MGKRWTDKEDTALLFILRSRPDATYAEIAEVLHRTELSVRARCIRIRNRGRTYHKTIATGLPQTIGVSKNLPKNIRSNKLRRYWDVASPPFAVIVIERVL